jgi:tetratricopeptide (TPR) repeat protein
MTYDDPRPVLLRIAKLEERLKERPKPRFGFLSDYSKAISISAFLISIVTTIYSWRKDDLQAHEAARRQFDATMEQLVDIGFKNFEFTAKNRNEPNFGAMAGWFNAQSGLMGNKAIQELAAIDDATIFDYIMVGNTLVSVGQPARASTLFRKAIEIGQQKKRDSDQIASRIIKKVEAKFFGKKIDSSLSDEQRVHDLGSAYTSLGQSLYVEGKSAEAEAAYTAALRTYAESNQSDDLKRTAVSFINKFWAEAVASLDCKSSMAHLRVAAENFADEKKIAENSDWNSIQYELSWGSSHCGSDGKLHGDQPSDISANAASEKPALSDATWPGVNTLPKPLSSQNVRGKH